MNTVSSSFQLVIMSVVIETTIGAVTVDLYTATRPKLCRNFLKLCKVKFYNFCLFHNVQPRFMAQTGDPEGTGRGGESVFRRLYGDQARFFDGDEDLPKIRWEIHWKYIWPEFMC